MASYETLKHFERIDVNFRRSVIDEVLPEYFREDYPNLISFLEGYYEYLDSDQSFQGVINELITVRDAEDAELSRMDLLFHSLALGVSQGRFKFPREAIKNFGNFFRVKGSLYSGQGSLELSLTLKLISHIQKKNSLLLAIQRLVLSMISVFKMVSSGKYFQSLSSHLSRLQYGKNYGEGLSTQLDSIWLEK